MSNLLNGIEEKSPTPFMHKGEWAVHNVLPIFLEHTGAASVDIATFNISEDSLRPLFMSVEKQAITQLRLLLDMNVKRHKVSMLCFAKGITENIRITSNHAKLLLVQNDRYTITLLGSANLNTNARWENGVMFTCAEIFNYFKTQFDNAYNTGHSFDF
ncbi:MAG: hypothetical protein ACRC9X_08760 [Bacteroidales bacterium]